MVYRERHLIKEMKTLYKSSITIITNLLLVKEEQNTEISNIETHFFNVPGDIRLHRLAPGNETIPSKDRFARYLRCPCTILVLVLECNLSIFAI